MSKHTPGPWHLLSELDGDGDILRICQTNAPSPGFHVALVYGHGGDIEHDTERTANAKLLAAAPEMLEALSQLVNYNESDPSLYEGDNDGVLGKLMWAANQAITKAEGK